MWLYSREDWMDLGEAISKATAPVSLDDPGAAPQSVAPTTDAAETAAPPQSHPLAWLTEVVSPATEIMTEVQQSPRDLDRGDIPALLGIAVAAIGVWLLILAATARRDHDRRRLAVETSALEARRATDLHVPAPDPISRFPPAAEAILTETTRRLGGLEDRLPGTNLDGERTAEATAEAGGRFRPHFHHSRRPVELTVLLGCEENGHLWLPVLRRLLWEWERRGVRLRTYTFGRIPDMVTPLNGGPSVPLADLARAQQRLPDTAPRPLLVAARSLVDEWLDTPAAWPGLITAWSHRAWLDPTPAVAPEVHGLRRFPLSDKGLRALAYHLAGGRVVAVPKPNLSPAEPTALAHWALAASLSPDTTWDQLEDLRRRLPEINSAFPHRADVEHLVRHVARDGSGDHLAFNREASQGLTAENPEFESRLRSLLIADLETRQDTLKAGTLDYALAELRILRHRYDRDRDPTTLAAIIALLPSAAGPEARQALEELHETKRLSGPAQELFSPPRLHLRPWSTATLGALAFAGMVAASPWLVPDLGRWLLEPALKTTEVMQPKTIRVIEPEPSVKDLVILQGHTGWVVSAAFSPDGKRIVTASEDQTARVWSADGTGTPVILLGHTDGVISATFSPDGKRIVTASDDMTVRDWNADGTGANTTFQGIQGRGRVILTAFGLIVTAHEDGSARVWSAGGTVSPLKLQGHAAGIISATFSPNGSLIVTTSEDGTARVWNADSMGSPVVLRGHDRRVNSAAFSLDGKRIVTTSDDQTARVWKANGTDSSVILRGHTGAVISAAFSPDGKYIITASEDHTARVWNTDGTGSSVILQGHTGTVISAAFSPDGKRIVTAGDNTARVWNTDGAGAPVILQGHTAEVRSAAFSPDGMRIVTASYDKTARVWNAKRVEAPP